MLSQGSADWQVALDFNVTSVSRDTGMEAIDVGRNPPQVMQADWLEARWYALFVRSNHEKHVALHLKDRAIEHFLPLYESLRQWSDRKVKLLCPLFPGYVFVRLPYVERTKVLYIPNVVNLVGTRTAPSAISDEEINWMKRGTATGKAQPHPFLKAGTRVRVKTGAMADMEGYLIRVQHATRVLISLDSITRAFVIEIDSDSLELAPPRGLQPQC